MRKLATSARHVAPVPSILTLAAICLIVAFADVGAGVRDQRPTGGQATETEDEPAEPVLGGEADPLAGAERPPEDDERAAARRGRPVVVEARAPGEAQGARARSEDGPPEHILRENAKLRRELKHLRALEAERRRVSRALAAAGIIDGGALVGSGRLSWPLTGPLTSPFGQRWGRLHAGIDISAPAGTPIRAADSGRVALAGWQGGYGLYTCVKHTASLSTCYAHQSRLGTSQGAAVRKGQVIGYVGNTGHSFGNHLHFETWVNGRPVDPMGFL
jgi:murein DD-endopeptidase MepM/ murein hydrolase activator NlpD